MFKLKKREKVLTNILHLTEIKKHCKILESRHCMDECEHDKDCRQTARLLPQAALPKSWTLRDMIKITDRAAL